MDTRIDSHKLLFHPDRVASWINKNAVMPINLEVCLIGACNHRCIFCCCDYTDYVPDVLPQQLLIENLRYINDKYGKNGIRSVLLAGTGEPLLYPKFAETVNKLKELRIDVALSTNGVLLTPDKIDPCLGNISWIRFSVSGGTEETYHNIQRGQPDDLQRVMDNIYHVAEVKKSNGYKTRLNVQIVLIPENEEEVIILAKKVKEAGADCLIVKSCGTGQGMNNTIGNDLDWDYYSRLSELREELDELNTGSFSTIFREERINNQYSERDYYECYASPFHAFIGADANVYPCCHFPGKKEYSFGSITECSLEDILSGKKGKRDKVLHMLENHGLKECPAACKLDPMNQYLNRLIHPEEHDNFI